MNKWGLNDWVVVTQLVVVLAASTVYVFMHPDSVTFGEWCALVGTVVSAYHWNAVKDSKIPDAEPR